MEKRGQATAFIILGIIVLVVVFGVIAVKNDLFKNLFQKITQSRETIPLQVKPIEDSLSSCIHNVGSRAVQLVSLQGGYLDLPNDVMPSTELSPLSSSLEIISGSGFETSVWFRERGNGIQELNVPTKNRIEQEISNYVDRNFESCISNLTYFNNKDYKLSFGGSPITKTSISDNDVDIVVDFPIDVSIQDNDFTLNDHHAVVNSKLGELYSMSSEMIDNLNTGYFLENQTINMLVAYNEEVPFSGTDFSCDQKIWYKNDVSRRLKNIIYENIAAVNVKDSNIDVQNKELKYLELDPFKSSHKDVTISLSYIPNWPTLVEINPSEGNVLKSDNIIKNSGGVASTIVSSFFCINTYRFVYNVKYPVLVTMRSSDGLVFQFATQVIVDHNQPRKNRMTTLDLPDSTSQLCQYPQRKVNVLTNTLDGNGLVIPLKDVNLAFKCFPASCPLGTSSSGNTPYLDVNIPMCYNGIFEGTKENYFVGKTLYSPNNPDSPDSVNVILDPVYKKKVNVYVIDKSSGDVREPYDSEQVNFEFMNKLSKFSSTLNYPDNKEVGLIAGDYIVNSNIIRNSTWKIKYDSQEIENCVDTRASGIFGFFSTEKKCFKTETDPVELDYVLTGGAKFENSFSRSDLSSDEPLNLYILSSPIPSDLEGLQKIQIETETNNEHPLFKLPNVGVA